MLGLGPIGFAAPWVLAGLVVLPAIWWVLRVTPPAPRRQIFPPLRLLLGLGGHEEATARTPWWLLLLRLLAALLILLGLARPVLNPGQDGDAGKRPLLLVIDNGWASAAGWNARHTAALAVLDRAARAGRPVQILTTAPETDGRPPRPGPLGTAEAARQHLLPLRPKPWPTVPGAIAKALRQAAAAPEESRVAEGAEAVWLNSDIARPGTAALAALLQHNGGLTVLTPSVGQAPLVLLPPERTAEGLALTLRRPAGGAPETRPPRAVTVRALDDRGRPVGAVPARFAAGAAGAAETTAVLPLPSDLRNTLGRLEAHPMAGGDTEGAAAVALLADQWRRHPVGIVTTGQAGDIPLLAPGYYLEKALAGEAEVKRGGLEALLDQHLSVLFAPDGSLPSPPPRRLAAWVEAGGVLVRFAGDRLAGADAAARSRDGLLPVAIRGGGRTLGGVLSWSEPAGLAPFTDTSPFAGLTVPKDVRVRAQVLAEPSADLSDRTWARLQDGTPLVTGAPRGRGWTVLIHTTANTAWTDLPLSGLFPHLLNRLAGLGQGLGQGLGPGLKQGVETTAGSDAPDAAARPLPPHAVLDGTGHLHPPSPDVLPLPAGALEDGQAGAMIGPTHPPGLYGREGVRQALNLTAIPEVAHPQVLGRLPAGVTIRPLDATPREVDLRGALLTAALGLLVVDTLAAFLLRGILPRGPGRRRQGMTAPLLLLAAGLTLPNGPARAQDPAPDPAPDITVPAKTLEAVLTPRLAYVRTGVPEVDRLSEAGLEALTKALARRSSAELATPAALDPATDDLIVYPLIYWPATDGQALPGPEERRAVSRYLNNGGLILFDGQDPDTTAPLTALLRSLDIPPLTKLPADHVLTRAFYLLNGLPGRVDGGPVWIDAAAARMEAVSPVIIGANDWAGAWARDSRDRPLLPVVSGGEQGRETAYRAGINMVMYALTGNYKADQVHLPAILERLTQ